jgi:type I restriction enzyme S subunit
MKRYPEYKESGCLWIGKIPSHWSIRRLKNTVSDFTNGIWGDDPTGSTEDIVCVRVADFNRNSRRVSLENPTYRKVSQKERRRRTLHDGDLLLEKSGGGDSSPVGFVVLFDHKVAAVCSNFIARMQISTEWDSRYVSHIHSVLYNTKLTTPHIKQTTGIQNLDHKSYFKELIPRPPLAEQKEIVAHLNVSLPEIDRFIAQKENLIELLQEQKTALIHQVISKGINPNTKTKPSNIENLGEIPEHWEIKRNKLIFREIKDRSATGKETRLSMSQKYGLVASDTLEDKTLQSESSEGFKVCKVNDLVLNRLKAHLGVFARATIPGSVSPDYTVLRLITNADVRYFEYLFRHPAYIGWFNKVVRGIIVGFWRLYTQDFYNITSVFPPPEEQKRIVEYILVETEKTNQSVATLEREIGLMKEYRTALIAEAVTGKIDVRN